MDLIYSRKRIKLPKIKITTRNNFQNFNFRNNKEVLSKSKKLIKIFTVIIIAVVVAMNIVKQIEPILEKECLIRAKSIATEISNKQASLVMDKYKYDDLCIVVKDDEQNIKMIKSNIIAINEITSEIALKIQNELNKLEKEFELYKTKFDCDLQQINEDISNIKKVNIELKSKTIGCTAPFLSAIG